MKGNIDPRNAMNPDALNQAVHQWAAWYACETAADNSVDLDTGYRMMRDEPGEVEHDFRAFLGREPEQCERDCLWAIVRNGGEA